MPVRDIENLIDDPMSYKHKSERSKLGESDLSKGQERVKDKDQDQNFDEN